MQLITIKISIISVIVFGLFVFTSNTSANQIDQFGQSVPDNFEQKIQSARAFRLPYSGEYNPESAISIIKGMIDVYPEYYRGYFNLGLSYAEIKDYSSAEKSFQKALEIKEKNKIIDTTIYNSAGWVCMNAGNYECAQTYFNKAIAANNDIPSFTTKAAYNNMGQLYFVTQRFEEAKKYLAIAKNRFGSSAAGETLELIDVIEKSRLKSRQ